MKISEFYNLKHINFDMGEISKNSWIKLKANYENIKGIVVHLGTSSYGETVIIFTPSVYAKDTKYFIRSLSFDRIELPNVDISFKEFIKNKNSELESLEREQDEILKEKTEFKDKYLQDILGFYYRYKIIEKIEELEGHIAESKNFILLSAFVPESKVESIKNSVEKVSESALIYFEDDNEIPSKFKIPTKLKNNFILRPFEALVKMYSIPDYKETDPTPFFAITYLLLFGMMFGDVGQGLIFVIAGMLLSKKFGVIAKYFISFGYLVPDDFTIQMIQEYLEENINTEEFKNGFILDGFPRTIIQARKLADICSMFNFKIDAVINLDIPEDVLVKRLSGRRTCADCGKSYHIVYNPPKKEGVCDVCGGELIQRSDESEEAVQVRIDTYNKQTKPLIDYYTMLGELTNVDGNQSMDEVAEEIYKVLDNLK